MNTGPLDAGDRKILIQARSLVPGEPPVPWRRAVIVPAAGGLAAGWDDQENVIVISATGYSVTKAYTGERLVRDRDSDRTYDALSPHCLQFTQPHNGQTIPIFGLISGDGIHVAHDGWELGVIGPWWPRETVVIARPDVPGVREGFLERAHALRLERLADWEWLRCGFSPSGKHFLIVGSGGAEVFSREQT